MEPKVSCLMVTRPARFGLAKEAVADFHAQTWANKELVVVTDEPLAAGDRSVFGGECLVVTVGRGSTLGSLRNDAVAASSGDFLIQWDDDDRYHPNRIEEQVRPLLTPTYAAASCLTSQLYYFTETRELYWVNWFRRRPKYCSVLIPGTVCVRSSVAKDCKYPESGEAATRGEDGHYLGQITAADNVVGVCTGENADLGWLYLRRFHGNNTWGYDRFISNALWMGQDAGWLKAGGRPELLERVFYDNGWGTPGTVKVMGRNGLAYTFEVQVGRENG